MTNATDKTAPSKPASDVLVNPVPTRITRSPDEEWLARCARDGAPEPITDDVVSAFLLQTFAVTIRGDGIRLTIRKQDLHYWAEDSVIIRDANIGQQFTAKIDADAPSCIHLFERVGKDKLRYVETIDQYIPPHMLDNEARTQVLAAKKRQIKRNSEELQSLHRADTDAAIDREISNAEKLQRVRTFGLSAPANPAPRPHGAASDPTTGVEPDRPLSSQRTPADPASAEVDSLEATTTARRFESAEPLAADVEALTPPRRGISAQIHAAQSRARRHCTEQLDDEAQRRRRNKNRVASLSAILEDY